MNKALMNCDQLKHPNMPIIVVSKVCAGEVRHGDVSEK